MLNVLREAFPGGLANLLIVLLLEAFAVVFAIPNDQLCTMASAVLCVVGLIVLFQVSRPLTGKRYVMIGVMALGVIICFAALGPVFDFVALDVGSALILGVLLVLAIFMMQTILKLFNFGDRLIERLRMKLNGRPVWTLLFPESEEDE